MSRQRWIILVKILRIAGVGAILVSFIMFYGLIGRASVARPHYPDPAKGLTAAIPWTHGSCETPEKADCSAYGTPEERDRVLFWFNFGFYSVVLIAAGEAINIYKLGNYSSPRKSEL